ncbi:transcriptional regulator with XRE-family HTH domain [Allocatelliglobosispora scoriae]|uniref:Transcriptional regulator with XRE-family HTH domain n=1 Tax=Allocatelliglobosispora scoriae TaxID=643052 RepID=A0A841BWH1_9ACTN|nr:helix-turn-helix transcriptional regulator [Allocatelliglobosispora scoriae]MBB5871499.1 transcriptional regulator with XRE-family HTH domain [Allocatelliglobosispora scoriae]
MPRSQPAIPICPPFPISGILRAARRRSDLSQRELARAAKVSAATVGRSESGTILPSINTFATLLAAAGFFLAVVDPDGNVLQPMKTRDDLRDGAERLYPAHLDVIPDPEPGEWWADIYGLARPPETFYRDRRRRDYQRRLSQWQVRVSKHRHLPEPRLHHYRDAP